MGEYSARTEIIEKITELADIDRIGLLSQKCDIAVSFAGGRTVKKYLDGSGICDMNLQVLGRSSDQLAVSEELNRICSVFDKIKKFPKNEKWDIRGISVGSMPSLKMRDTDGTWVFSCILTVRYYEKTDRRNLNEII